METRQPVLYFTLDDDLVEAWNLPLLQPVDDAKTDLRRKLQRGELVAVGRKGEFSEPTEIVSHQWLDGNWSGDLSKDKFGVWQDVFVQSAHVLSLWPMQPASVVESAVESIPPTRRGNRYAYPHDEAIYKEALECSTFDPMLPFEKAITEAAISRNKWPSHVEEQEKLLGRLKKRKQRDIITE